MAGCANTPSTQELDFKDSVSAKTSKEKIRNVIRTNKDVIKSCYEDGLNRNANLKGKVILKWSIITGGFVSKNEVIANTTNDKVFGECIAEKVKTFVFPDPGEKSGIVTFPFLFSSNQQTKNGK